MFSNLEPPQKGSFTNLHHKDSVEQMPYLSTSHYLREQLGMEKSVQDSKKFNSSKSGKQIEDYIDELTLLKKVRNIWKFYNF